MYFWKYHPPTLVHLPLRFTSASKPAAEMFLAVVSATSTPAFQPLRHQRNVCHKGGFIAEQTDGSCNGPNPGCKADGQAVPIEILEFSRELLGL
jgi:hypothetical protein